MLLIIIIIIIYYYYYYCQVMPRQVISSPFVERLLKKGYEVLYLVEAIDEYSINALPEFEGKKFQNVAKEGLTLSEGEAAKEHTEELKKKYEPLTKWLAEEALKDHVSHYHLSWVMLINTLDSQCLCDVLLLKYRCLNWYCSNLSQN